jgi:hypothetical protein
MIGEVTGGIDPKGDKRMKGEIVTIEEIEATVGIEEMKRTRETEGMVKEKTETITDPTEIERMIETDTIAEEKDRKTTTMNLAATTETGEMNNMFPNSLTLQRTNTEVEQGTHLTILEEKDL